MCYDDVRRDEIFYNFRPGCLCGLDGQARLEVQRREGYRGTYGGRLFSAPPITGVNCKRISGANTKASLDSSLKDVLDGCLAEDLRKALRRAGISAKSGLRKAELVTLLAEGLPKAIEGFRSSAELLGGDAITLLQRTFKGETVNYKRQKGRFSIPDVFPYAFVTKSGPECVAFTPTELREAFAEIDLDPYLEGKHALEVTNRALHAVTTLCGVMSLDRIFTILSRDEENAFTKEQFDNAVRLLTADRFQSEYRTIESDGVTYITRCQPYWPNSVGSRFYWRGNAPYGDWRYSYCDASPRSRLRELMAQQRNVPFTRFETGLSAQAAISEYLYGLPCVRGLTAYLDAHVPSGQDDCSFADDMVDFLIWLMLIDGQSLKAILAWLTRTGWYLSEGTNSAPVLTKLICDLFSELPRWEYCGWSEREFLDLMDLPYIISESQRFDDDSLELAS